jgi:medium-chain acyl-[acyl-carrier-protein] hydrolase
MTSKDLPGQQGIPIYEEPCPVFSFLLDPRKRLSIPALFGILGDAAGRDATRRGWGYDELARRNQAWVLIRSRLKINRQPAWGERMIIRTWPKNMDGVIAYRDFQIMDDAGNILITGTSAWTLIDLFSRKPVRLIGREYETGDLANYHAIPDKPAKIEWPPKMTTAAELKVKYGLLDMNNHVNNSRYIEMVMNELPISMLMDRQLNEIEVNFISEVIIGDDIGICLDTAREAENVFSGFIKKMENDRQAFAARFTFAK